MTARVGILLPTYNRATLLPGAIDSVLRQDFESWVLLVVDDNSSDDTEQVVKRYAEADSRIRYLRNDRFGHSPAGARRRGLLEVDEEFVAFLDSDDQWPSYHLSEFVEILDANADIDCVFGDICRVSETGEVLVRSKIREEWTGRHRFETEEREGLFVIRRERLVETALAYDLKVAFQPSLVRRRVFEVVELPEVPRAGDRLFMLMAADAGFVFAYVARNHLRYLVHGGNMSGARPKAAFEHLLRVNTEMERYWREQVPGAITMTPERRKIIRRRLANHLVWMLGNKVYRAHGMRWHALRSIARGITLRPLEWSYWKTLFGTALDWSRPVGGELAAAGQANTGAS